MLRSSVIFIFLLAFSWSACKNVKCINGKMHPFIWITGYESQSDGDVIFNVYSKTDTTFSTPLESFTYTVQDILSSNALKNDTIDFKLLFRGVIDSGRVYVFSSSLSAHKSIIQDVTIQMQECKDARIPFFASAKPNERNIESVTYVENKQLKTVIGNYITVQF